jgi:hypothetical protein
VSEILRLQAEIEQLTRERNDYKAWWERDSRNLGAALSDLSLERACKQDRLSQIERLRKALDNRSRQLGIQPTVHEPLLGQCHKDEVKPSSLPPEFSEVTAIFARQMQPNTRPLTHQEIFHAVNSWAAEIVRLTAAVPAQCMQGASRDEPGVVQRVCHALTDDCVMFTDPEREPCTPENCKAVKASRDASSEEQWPKSKAGEAPFCNCIAVTGKCAGWDEAVNHGCCCRQANESPG